MGRKLGMLFTCFIIGLLITVACTKSNSNQPSTEKLQETTEITTTEIIVSAAENLKDSMLEITANYVVQNPTVNISFNFGTSDSLQQQIEQGSPTDIFIPAGKKQMDDLEQKDLILKNTKINLLSNDQSTVLPAAVVKTTKHQAEAEKFLKYLTSDEATNIFIKHGFKKGLK